MLQLVTDPRVMRKVLTLDHLGMKEREVARTGAEMIAAVTPAEVVRAPAEQATVALEAAEVVVVVVEMPKVVTIAELRADRVVAITTVRPREISRLKLPSSEVPAKLSRKPKDPRRRGLIRSTTRLSSPPLSDDLTPTNHLAAVPLF